MINCKQVNINEKICDKILRLVNLNNKFPHKFYNNKFSEEFWDEFFPYNIFVPNFLINVLVDTPHIEKCSISNIFLI